MQILFVSNNFSPEVNPPAVRMIEHVRQWVASGYEVEGIDVVRVPMHIAENKGPRADLMSN